MYRPAIRRLQLTDSLEHLTGLLRRAFSSLGRQDLNCTCVDPSVDTTLQRIGLGDCLVAVVARRVGNATVHGVDRGSPVHTYRNPTVASIHQFAADPSHQGSGIGRSLLCTAEQWARSRRYSQQLALDTPAPAEHLRACFGRRGFVLAETIQLPDKSYLSVALRKAINAHLRPLRPVSWPARHPAEMAALQRGVTQDPRLFH